VPAIEDAPASNVLAVHNRVEEVKSYGREMSRSECHSLAVFFSLRSATEAPRGANEKILQLKLGALSFFQRPASEWLALFTDFAAPNTVQNPYAACACHCGCTTRMESSMCLSCHRMCCKACHITMFDSDVPVEAYMRETRDGKLQVCHNCATPSQPKVKGLTFTAHAVNGLKWYFNFPCIETDPPNNNLDDPCRWCNPNRNVSMDPPLVDVVEVYKVRKLENVARQVRPHSWENAFELEIIVSDVSGGHADVRINLFCFMMNPTWKNHSIVKYLADWLPANLSYRGPVLKMPTIFKADVALPPCPNTPDHVIKSTVQIEEMDEEATAKAKSDDIEFAEMRAIIAAGPQDSDGDDDEEVDENDERQVKKRKAHKEFMEEMSASIAQSRADECEAGRQFVKRQRAARESVEAEAAEKAAVEKASDDAAEAAYIQSMEDMDVYENCRREGDESDSFFA
jgi:hypothetical protein